MAATAAIETAQQLTAIIAAVAKVLTVWHWCVVASCSRCGTVHQAAFCVRGSTVVCV
jgi:hypothetical protein